MFRNNTFVKYETINVQFGDGGLGDNICRLPVIKYIKDNYQFVNMICWIPDYFLEFAQFTVPNVNFQPYSSNKNYNESLTALSGSSLQHSSMRTHLVDHAFNVILDKQVTNNEKNYLQINTDSINIQSFYIPKKYVVITTGYTAEVREMVPKTINELSDYIISKGYIPVYLGNEKTSTGIEHIIKGNFNDQINFTKGIDLRNKTSLLEAHHIISKAKCIIGLDNGLLHLAGMTQVPIVAGFTTVDPNLRAPYRNNILGWNFYPVVPPEEIKCKFCQSDWCFVYDHSFTTCYYKDKACIYSLTSNLYIKELEKIL